MDFSNPRIKKAVRAYKSKAKKTKNKLSVTVIRAFFILLIVLFFALGSTVLGAYIGILENAPKLDYVFDAVATDGTYTTIIINEKTGLETDRLDGGESREYVDSERIPEIMKNAMIAIEDERFYEHDGVDFKGMFRAAYATLTSDHTEGASTITQQVIKNKLEIRFNSIETKLQEQMLALDFEKALIDQLGSKEKAKDYILTIYLNGIALGHGQIGVQAAALYYFNKNVWELTLSECAVIAAITSNPSRRSPVSRPESNRQRQLIVLNNMLRLGTITEDEYNEAVNDDVYARVHETNEIYKMNSSIHSYFYDRLVSVVIDDLMEKYSLTRAEANNLIYYGGLTIYSTEDQSIQKIVDDAYLNEELFPRTDYEIAVTYAVTIKNELTSLTKSYEKKFTVKKMDDVEPYAESIKDKLLKDGDVVVSEQTYPVVQPQSAFIVIDYHTGHVVALAGGRGEKLTNRSLNRATDSLRQPGSTFKVLASYAPALDLGLITPATVIDDVPYFIPTEDGGLKEWPKNWYANSGFRGLKSVRDGITQSMNILAVKNLADLGMTNAFNYLYNFGFTTLSDDPNHDRNLSLAIGGLYSGVSQEELAAAYGTIANEGYYNKPVYYTKVLDHNGNVILENNHEPVQVLKKTTSYLLTDMLIDTVISGTASKARFSQVKMPTAGKTGTTSETKDLVFAGFTPYYAATVWLGYDTPKTLNSTTTGDGIHLRLWGHIMEEIHRNLPYKDFPKPDGIVQVQVCSVSGKLPISGLCDHDQRGSMVKTAIFEAGTEPTEYCDSHMSYRIDVTTGKIPTQYCPDEYIATVIGIVRPEPYYGDKLVLDRWVEVPRAILSGEMCTDHMYPGWYTPPVGTNGEDEDNADGSTNRNPMGWDGTIPLD